MRFQVQKLVSAIALIAASASLAHAQSDRPGAEYEGSLDGFLSGGRLDEISETIKCFEENYASVFAGTSVTDDLELTLYTTPGGKRKYNKCDVGDATVEKAEYPLARLKAAQKRLERLRDANPTVPFGFGINQAGNVLDIEVEPGFLEQFNAIIGNTLRSMPFAEVSEGTSYKYEELAYIDGAYPAGHCTLGFNAKKNTASGDLTGNVTAAHCGRSIPLDYEESPAGPAGTPNRKYIFKSDAPNSFALDAWADIQFVVSDTDTFGPYMLYPDTTNKHWIQVARTRSLEGLSQGTPMCKVGKQTQLTCGDFLGTFGLYAEGADGSYKYRNMPIFDNQNTVIGIRGDSGSPVFLRTYAGPGVPEIWALGVLSAGSKMRTATSPRFDRLHFTPISEFNRIGATVQTTKGP